MVNKSELRVGNWIQDDAQIFSIKEILSDSLVKDIVHRRGTVILSAEEDVNITTEFERCEPIKLTAEIMFRIGAEGGGDTYTIRTESRTFMLRRYNNLCFHVYQKDTDSNEFGVGTVCSLHFLQNLIFFIANEELIISG